MKAYVGRVRYAQKEGLAMQTIMMTKPVTGVQVGDRLLIPWTWFHGLPPQELPPRFDEFRVPMWPVEVCRIGTPSSSSRVLQVRNVINGQVLSTEEVRAWWELCLYTNDSVRDALYRYTSAPASDVHPGDRFLWQDQLLEVVTADFQGTPDGGPTAQVRLTLAAIGGQGPVAESGEWDGAVVAAVQSGTLVPLAFPRLGHA
jgi:hypothetical protein